MESTLPDEEFDAFVESLFAEFDNHPEELGRIYRKITDSLSPRIEAIDVFLEIIADSLGEDTFPWTRLVLAAYFGALVEKRRLGVSEES